MDRKSGNMKVFDSSNTYDESQLVVMKKHLKQLSHDLRIKKPGPSTPECEIEWPVFPQQQAGQPDCGPITLHAISQLAMDPEQTNLSMKTNANAIERLRLHHTYDLSRNITSSSNPTPRRLDFD